MGAAAVGIALLAAACSSGGHHNVAVGGTSSSTMGGDAVVGGSGAPGTDAATTTTKPGAKAKPGAKTVTVTTIVNGHVVKITVPVTDGGGSGGSGGSGGGGAGSSPTTPKTPTTIEQPVPYDPSKPINLCCTPGVTPQEQARAEQLVRDTLKYLPHWASEQTAINEGYRSIQDGFTGDEHFVKWSLVDDNDILDAQHPESLVYENGKLAAAMYMMKDGSTFADTPDIGGALTQWHVHNDLCLEQNPHDPLQWYLRGVTTSNGQCTATGAIKKGDVPMIHVWIIKNACGPFAPLEGEGGGQTPPGQAPLCDHAHGSK